MKKSTIKTGEVYQVKVSGKLTEVRILGGNPHGGWDGVNIATNKPVSIKPGTQLRKPVSKKAKQAAQEPAKSAKPSESKETNATAKPKKERTPSESSGLTAAAKVLADAGEPLNCQEMVKRMLDQGLWKTEGKTPAATIYAAIIREIRDKGDAARFRKTERGKFAIAAK